MYLLNTSCEAADGSIPNAWESSWGILGVLIPFPEQFAVGMRAGDVLHYQLSLQWGWSTSLQQNSEASSVKLSAQDLRRRAAIIKVHREKRKTYELLQKIHLRIVLASFVFQKQQLHELPCNCFWEIFKLWVGLGIFPSLSGHKSIWFVPERRDLKERGAVRS